MPAEGEDVLDRLADPTCRTLVMAVLNVTPDSFSGDGSLDLDRLLEQARSAVQACADLLDVGGESTRPGAAPVPVEEEMRRVLPVVERLAAAEPTVPISIDTMKPAVAEAALAAGARVVNDVSGLADPDLATVAARHSAWLVLTHNRWTARAARDALGGFYPEDGAGDVVDEVVAHLQALARAAIERGVPSARLTLDPGLGFGKSPRESLELLRRTAELCERLSPYPLLVGASRKSFVGRALGLPAEDRLEASLACAAIAAFAGARVVRVHDVAASVRVTRMAWAIRRGREADLPTA